MTVAVDAGPLRNGWLGNLTVGLGVVMTFGSMFGLSLIGKQMMNQSQSLRQVAEEDNRKLKEERQENLKKTKDLEEARALELRRQWSAEGVAAVSTLLRKTSSEAVYDALISAIVKYLEANQGGLFLVNRQHEEPHIELKACYAYQRKKYLDKVIMPGEGILGQAYLEKLPVHLSEVPEEYVRITSGLGQATPKNLLIVPMLVNEEIEGLIEIASFREFEAHHIELVMLMAETIGSYSLSARTMDETRLLLEQSREQSEELQAAEEEMRQNQEELQATQEEMQRRFDAQNRVIEQQKEREEELLERLSQYQDVSLS